MAGYYRGGQPRVLYRGQDEESATWYNNSRGFRARRVDPDISFEYRNRRERSRLAGVVRRHPDWRSGEPSPFISAYEYPQAAFHEARTRVEDRRWHSEVCVHEITVFPRPRGHRERIEYRWVPGLHEDLGEICYHR